MTLKSDETYELIWKYVHCGEVELHNIYNIIANDGTDDLTLLKNLANHYRAISIELLKHIEALGRNEDMLCEIQSMNRQLNLYLGLRSIILRDIHRLKTERNYYNYE